MVEVKNIWFGVKGIAEHGRDWVGVKGIAEHGRDWVGVKGIAEHGRDWVGVKGIAEHGTLHQKRRNMMRDNYLSSGLAA